MRLLVVDQCSGSKDYPSGSEVYSAKEIDQYGRETLVERDESAAVEAKDLYTGRQQRYIDDAVDTLRSAGHNVDRCFVSAGFGVVDEDTFLPPYEVTFNDMSAGEIDDRAEQLGIAADIRSLVTEGDYDIAFFALGSKYYRAVDLDGVLEILPTKATAVLFNQEERAEKYTNTLSIPARTDEAKQHGTIVVALKGVYLQNFAEHLAHEQDIEDHEDIRTFCTTKYGQTGLSDF